MGGKKITGSKLIILWRCKYIFLSMVVVFLLMIEMV